MGCVGDNLREIDPETPLHLVAPREGGPSTIPGALASRAGSLRGFLAAGALAGVFASSFVIVAAAASRPSFLVPLSGRSYPDWLAGPLAGYGPKLDQGTFELLVVGMCVCYVVSLAVADRLRQRAALAVIAAIQLVFLLGPPLLSPDVSSYLAYARLSLHGLDPYLHAPSALPPGDALHAWVVHATGPTNYGPPFTLLTYPLAHIGVAAAVWVLKLAATAASLGLVALVAGCARQRGVAPARAALLVGLNPVLLIYGLGGFHNDLWMMAVLMVGVWLTLRARPAAGAAAGVLATGLKVSAAPATLLMILGSGRSRRALLAAAVTALALAVIVLVGFGHGDVFVNYLRQLSHGGHAFARRYSVPALAGQAFGLGGIHGVTSGVRLVAVALLALAVVALVALVRRGADWLDAASWAQFAALVTTTWLWPWYIVWVLPLAALARTRWLFAAALALSAFLVATQVFLPLG